MSSYHLLGTVRDLFHWPAVFINSIHALWFERNGRGQQPGLFEIRIINCGDIKGLVLLVWDGFVQDQITPNLYADFTSVLNPRVGLIV